MWTYTILSKSFRTKPRVKLSLLDDIWVKVSKLSDILIGVAQEKGLKTIYGIVLSDNRNVLNRARKLGFTVKSVSGEESRVELEL